MGPDYWSGYSLNFQDCIEWQIKEKSHPSPPLIHQIASQFSSTVAGVVFVHVCRTTVSDLLGPNGKNGLVSVNLLPGSDFLCFFFSGPELFSKHYYRGERFTRTCNLSYWLLIVSHITSHWTPTTNVSTTPKENPFRNVSSFSSSATAISSSIPLYILLPLLVHFPIFVGSFSLPFVLQAALLCVCLCPHEVDLARHCHCRAFHSHQPTTDRTTMTTTTRQSRFLSVQRYNNDDDDELKRRRLLELTSGILYKLEDGIWDCGVTDGGAREKLLHQSRKCNIFNEPLWYV